MCSVVASDVRFDRHSKVTVAELQKFERLICQSDLLADCKLQFIMLPKRSCDRYDGWVPGQN